jgi:DNA processing protein
MGWRDWEVKKVKKGEEGYPKSLLEIDDPPEQLYYRGNWSEEIFSNCLAVVGTRRISRYGEAVVEKLIPGLVEAGLTIVSGFMYGVDSKAHEVCVERGGKTIAVLGSGINVLCPRGNGPLYEKILNSGGLVVSEYEPETEAERWQFPQRNRIVAGLSKAVLAVEGGEKSGTLITARLGAEQGKTVMVVPGPITSAMSVGTNELIRKGAVPVTKVEEILLELGMDGLVIKEKRREGLEGLEKKVAEELEKGERGVDELARGLGKDVVVIGSVLSVLGLKGVVEERNGEYNLRE